MTTSSLTSTSDVIVIGGGLVGSAVAYGMARDGAQVLLVDEGDDAFGASVGNFGLVWVQGKGLGQPSYAQWTRGSASLWPLFADALRDETGVDAHVNPLKLLLALRKALSNRGGRLVNSERVERIDAQRNGFIVHGQRQHWTAARVVLAAGLGNRNLAPAVGLQAPVV